MFINVLDIMRSVCLNNSNYYLIKVNDLYQYILYNTDLFKYTYDKILIHL